MKSLLESLNIALFESKTVKSTVKDFFSWYFDEDCDDLVKDGDLAPRCADLLDDVELNNTIKKLTHKDYDQDGLASIIQSNFNQPISVKFDEAKYGFTAQFSIKDKKFGIINFNFNPTSATLKPSE